MKAKSCHRPHTPVPCNLGWSRARMLTIGACVTLLACYAGCGPLRAQVSDQIEAAVARVGALDKIIDAAAIDLGLQPVPAG